GNGVAAVERCARIGRETVRIALAADEIADAGEPVVDAPFGARRDHELRRETETVGFDHGAVADPRARRLLDEADGDAGADRHRRAFLIAFARGRAGGALREAFELAAREDGDVAGRDRK